MIKRFWYCRVMRSHDWTSAVWQGLDPTEKQLEDGMEGFLDYAKMYCARCGKLSPMNHRTGHG